MGNCWTCFLQPKNKFTALTVSKEPSKTLYVKNPSSTRAFDTIGKKELELYRISNLAKADLSVHSHSTPRSRYGTPNDNSISTKTPTNITNTCSIPTQSPITIVGFHPVQRSQPIMVKHNLSEQNLYVDTLSKSPSSLSNINLMSNIYSSSHSQSQIEMPISMLSLSIGKSKNLYSMLK